MLKSETIERKFIWSKNIEDYEIETDSGFVDVVSINKTIPYLKYIIKTETGKILKCADNHILFTDNMSEIFAKEALPGKYIFTNDGYEQVVECINTNEYENMYDFELPENTNHRYFTNGILSHNTLLAKMLAKEIFGDEKALIRFDMSEYPDKTAVNKLIGSNPGYVGYEDGGLLTEAVKNRKHCVLLLDEIEKADKDVYNIFLQVLDEGFLTDNSGMKVDFRNVIIIFTSNVGAKTASDFSKVIGFVDDEGKNTKKVISKELKNKFPPEFLNRLNDIIYFNNLTDNDLEKIIGLELKKSENRINKIGYELKYNDDVVKYLLNIVKEEKEFGARPVIRTIQTEIEDRITDMLLDKEYEQQHIFNVTCNENKIAID